MISHMISHMILQHSFYIIIFLHFVCCTVQHQSWYTTACIYYEYAYHLFHFLFTCYNIICRFGRRTPLLLVAPLQALSSFLICFTSNIYAFIFLRTMQSTTLYFMLPSAYVICKLTFKNSIMLLNIIIMMLKP